MTTSRADKSAPRKSAPLPAILIGVFVLLGVLVWLYRANFVPAAAPDLPKSANETRMEKIYRNSGGDLNRLSAEDRDWLHTYSKGREQDAFNYYKGRLAKQSH